MPRFFMPEAGSLEKTVLITGRDAEHIRVLRMRPGEELTVCDGAGTDLVCRLIRSERELAEAEILRREICPGEPDISATVYCGLPKGDKTDLIIQKSVELGASEIVFFDSERVVQRTEGVGKKLDRWLRISEEAAKQCGRGIIPPVRWKESFQDAMHEAASKELALFMYETGDRTPLSAALNGVRGRKSAAIVTGPEGGFEPEEAELAESLGMSVCSMGGRILRCETAPLAALTALMFAGGNLD